MLQTIREYTQGWIAGTVMTIVILSFALWGVHSYFVGGGGPSNIAEVNGIGITKNQFSVAYERLRNQIQAQYGVNSPFAGKDNLLKDRALKDLIDIEVLKQASLQQGFYVSDSQVESVLQARPEFQIDGQFSVERLQQALAQNMMSANELFEILKTNLLIEQPKFGIVLSAFSSPDEIKYVVSLVNQERDFDYLTIPKSYFLSQPITVTPQQIQAYYNQHKKEFMTPEQVSVEYLQLSVKDLMKQSNVSDDKLENFYKENVSTYTQPVQWKVEDIEVPLDVKATPEETKVAKEKADAIYQQLVKGGDFAKVAGENLGNLSSTNWLAINEIPVELQKSVSTLKKGQVTEPFVTSKGFVIVKAVDYQPSRILTFKEVKDRVKENYNRQFAEEKLAESRDRLADLTYEHPDTLQIASKNLNLPILTSELFSKDKPGKGIAESKRVRDVAFSIDVLQSQNNSDVIQVNPDTLVVLRVKDHVPAKVLSLAEVTPQIEQKLKKQQADIQAEKFAQDLLAKLQAGTDPAQVANITKLTWTKAGFLTRYANKPDPAISDVVFRLPNPSNHQNKAMYGIARLNDGLAIIRLISVKPGVFTDTKESGVYAEQFQAKDGLLEYEMYKRSQVADAKISLAN